MAIENELKYVMPLEFNVRALSHEWKGANYIEQAYLDCQPYITIENDRPIFGFNHCAKGFIRPFRTEKIELKDFEKLKSTASPFVNGQHILNKESVRLRNETGTLYITYKELIDGDLIEIEDNDVDAKLFNDLYPHCVDPVHKYRYQQKTGKDKWFLDVLHDRATLNERYFVQAEVEMPEGVEKPSFIPPEIKNDILFEVPRNDERFTNRNLSDVNSTKALYASLLPK